MKGIILAGGHGKRLYPATLGVCKQLLPIYDKPMIYYPLSVLLLAGIKEILIISTPQDTPRFQTLLKDGAHLGIDLSYETQPSPNGIAEAFLLGRRFIGNDPVCLVLGDNIFHGHGLSSLVKQAVADIQTQGGGILFGYEVDDPTRYGIAELDPNGTILSITEKPATPQSNWAITGLYFFDNDVVRIASRLTPSHRGELEITDIHNHYLKQNSLMLHRLERGFAWLDTGTHESLLEASQFVETIEKRQGLKIACLEEIAYSLGYISKETLSQTASLYHNTPYGNYLHKLLHRT